MAGSIMVGKDCISKLSCFVQSCCFYAISVHYVVDRGFDGDERGGGGRISSALAKHQRRGLAGVKYDCAGWRPSVAGRRPQSLPASLAGC